jgi:hypothetical protein
VKLMALKDQLLEIELEVVELLQGLLQEFDRNYSEISENNKTHYNTYFTQASQARQGHWLAFGPYCARVSSLRFGVSGYPPL